LGKDRTTAAIDLVQRLETLTDVAQLLDAVTVAAKEELLGSIAIRATEPAVVPA
jgi:hypothetical protein